MYKVVTQAEFREEQGDEEEERERKRVGKWKRIGKEIKEQQMGARRVSRRLKSSQVLYEGDNYRGRWGETGRGMKRETGGEEGGKRESGRKRKR